MMLPRQTSLCSQLNHVCLMRSMPQLICARNKFDTLKNSRKRVAKFAKINAICARWNFSILFDKRR